MRNDLTIQVGELEKTLLLDRFTDADAITLQNHTPDISIGAEAWGNATATTVWEILSNAADLSTAVALNNNITIETKQSDVIITCDVTTGTVATILGIYVRSSEEDSGWEIGISTAFNEATITKQDAGARNQEASGSVTINNNTTFALKVVCRGDTIEVFVDEIFIVSNADAFNQLATRHGLFQFAAITDGAWDNFKVTASSVSPDIRGELQKAEAIQFDTGYPGGLHLGASMQVPRDIVAAWLIQGAQRLRILNGLKVVYEGRIANFDRALTSDKQSILIKAIGPWGSLLASRRLLRLYADLRTSADVWVNATPRDVHVDQTVYARFDADAGIPLLRATPQSGVTWGSNDRTTLAYFAPPGEEIRRVDFTGQLDEAGQDWRIRIRDRTNNQSLYTRTATGTDSAQNVEPAAGCKRIDFHLTNLAGSTIPSSGAGVFGELRDLVVYATMNHNPAGGKDTVDLTEITKDIRAEIIDLSEDESLIDSNTLSLVPFVAPRHPTMADILSRASDYGDSSANRWATGVRGSHLAGDDKPIIFAEQFPDLTTGAFDYAIRIDESNLVPPFQITEGYIGSDENRVWNYIIVEYADERGFTFFQTAEDDVLLKDQASIDKYGRRDFKISIGHGTTTLASSVGKRFLATHKDPPWNIKGPISVKEFIRSDKGYRIPASEIEAGRRLKLENFLTDPATGALELIFLVTKTSYVDDEQVNSLTVGVPNSLDVYLAQRELVDERLLT